MPTLQKVQGQPLERGISKRESEPGMCSHCKCNRRHAALCPVLRVGYVGPGQHPDQHRGSTQTNIARLCSGDVLGATYSSEHDQ